MGGVQGDRSMQVSWNKCGQNPTWCALQTLNLEHEHFNGMEGVYIIWHGGPKPTTVRVGQGVIRDRLQQHRTDPAITKYQDLGLYVTWAKVDAVSRDGVERFLAEQLTPKVGDRFPSVLAVTVNLPW